MIRNIIFDIGNVLTDFGWKEFLAGKGFDAEMVRRIAKASFASPLWPEADRGVLSQEELLREFIKQDPEIEGELRTAFDDIHGMVTARDYAIPWVRNLKEKGYGVYYLSNFSDKAYRECADALGFLPYMDGGIFSYLVRMVKPDPEIYRLLLSRFSLKASECVFLDDLPANVEAARAEGMAGIVFKDQEQARAGLAELGMSL